jgi:hypothetical protein
MLCVLEMSELMIYRSWQSHVFPALLSFMTVDRFTTSQEVRAKAYRYQYTACWRCVSERCPDILHQLYSACGDGPN